MQSVIGNCENRLLLSAILHKELFAGVFEHSTHDTSETEKGQEKEGVGTRSDSRRAPQKNTKALSFRGLFFYCCAVGARLSGLLHNAGPL